LFRVANFPDNITIPAAAKDDAYKLVEGFYDPNFDEAKHLIISGVPGSGKSSLAVAIGTEFVFRLGLCRYMTLAQLLQYIDPKPKPSPGRKIDAAFEEFDSGRVIWLWDKVNLLIVDDVEDIARVTHDPQQDSDAQNQQVIDMLMKQFRGDHLVQKLKGRPRTIWVCNHPVRPEGLKMILEKLLGYQNITIVHLTDTVEAAKQRK
jgi:DNA replication protein DnaC